MCTNRTVLLTFTKHQLISKHKITFPEVFEFGCELFMNQVVAHRSNVLKIVHKILIYQ